MFVNSMSQNQSGPDGQVNIDSLHSAYARQDYTASFHRGLVREVREHLGALGLNYSGGSRTLRKAILIGMLWAASYVLLLSLGAANIWWAAVLIAPFSFLMTVFQFCVMHDGSHRAFGSRPYENVLAALAVDLIGGNATLWRAKHVKAHHGHTMIHGKDLDLEAGVFLRLHRCHERRLWHRFQHFYAWALYAMLAFKWMWFDDAIEVIANRYRLNRRELTVATIELAVAKPWHLFLFILVPAYVLGWPAAGAIYLISWACFGLLISVVFQLAHITGVQAMPSSEEGIESDWALHQLQTTANFSTNNRFVSWWTGGLNHQIEHHIFPNMSHVHYPVIRQVVEDYCARWNVPYNTFPTMWSALTAHAIHLKDMGAGTKIAEMPS